MKTHRDPAILDILKAVKQAIRQPYAWPGGYPLSIICNDGGLICPDCAKKEWHQVCHDTLKGWRTGWDVAGVDVMWEGGNYCDQCNANLDAYSSEESQNEGWHLIKIENGEETLIGKYAPKEGQYVMGCDMHEWMVEAGHYGDLPSEEYEWEGDSESVAIMAPREGMPEFRFEWKGEQP